MLAALIKKELLALARDPQGLAALFVMPVIFIVIMSTTTAVESVKVEHLTVARSYGATPLQTFFKVTLPLLARHFVQEEQRAGASASASSR